jgi:hypothetical protein
MSFHLCLSRSQDSVVGIATGQWAGRPRGRSSSSVKVKNVLFTSRPALGPTQPPFQRVPEAPSPGVKRPGDEADHSPPAGADVKKIWICTLDGVVLN